MLARAVAFSLFTCAAFAWSLPWLDRVGTAALGFAFLALSVGRGSGVSRPSIFERLRLVADEPVPAADPVTRMLRDAGLVEQDAP